MISRTLTIYLLIGIPLQMLAQIPNGGFENWAAVDTFELPEHWNIQPMDYPGVSKSQNVHSGAFAIKLSSQVPTLEGFKGPQLEQTIVLDPQALRGIGAYIKFDNIVDTAEWFIQAVFTYSDGTSFSNWKGGSTKVKDWKKIEIGADSTNLKAVETIKIRLYGGAFIFGHKYCGYADFYVDDINLLQVTTPQRNVSSTSVSIFPNPVQDGILYVENIGYNLLERVSLYDVAGRKVLENTSNGELDVHRLDNGMYILTIQLVTGEIITKPIAINKS